MHPGPQGAGKWDLLLLLAWRTLESALYPLLFFYKHTLGSGWTAVVTHRAGRVTRVVEPMLCLPSCSP